MGGQPRGAGSGKPGRPRRPPGPPGRRRHHVPLHRRPRRPLVLVFLPPAERGQLVGGPRLPLQHIGAGARPRPGSPAAARRRRGLCLAAALRFAPSPAAPPPLPVRPPRRLPPIPVATPQQKIAIAAGRTGARGDAGSPGERAWRRQQQPGNYGRALRAPGAGLAPAPRGLTGRGLTPLPWRTPAMAATGPRGSAGGCLSRHWPPLGCCPGVSQRRRRWKSWSGWQRDRATRLGAASRRRAASAPGSPVWKKKGNLPPVP